MEMGGHDVKHIDSIVDELSVNETLKKVLAFNPQLILVDTSTPSIISDINFCKKLKEILPKSIVACVGTFPSKNTSEFFKICADQEAKVDLVLRGEYEETALELADHISKGTSYKNIDGIAYEDSANSDFITNGELKKTSEIFLDKLPYVSDFYLRHFGEPGIKRHFYASINWPYIQVLTARGCPYQCSFCNIPSIGSYRVRSIQSVVDEFKFIEKHLPFVKEVFIEDDTFPINKKRTIELCQKIIDANIKLTWSCNARVNTSKEVLEIMKKAGCRLTCVGFESPTELSLKDIKKKTSIQQQEEFMQDANQVGMKVNGCFILGLPGDTEKSIQKTIKYSKVNAKHCPVLSSHALPWHRLFQLGSTKQYVNPQRLELVAYQGGFPLYTA